MLPVGRIDQQAQEVVADVVTEPPEKFPGDVFAIWESASVAIEPGFIPAKPGESPDFFENLPDIFLPERPHARVRIVEEIRTIPWKDKLLVFTKGIRTLNSD